MNQPRPADPSSYSISDQRRSSERFSLMLDPLLLDNNGRVIARVGDLSLEGALLYGKGVPYPVGTSINGWLDSPSLGVLDEKLTAVWMRVAWSIKESKSGWFKAGCLFDHNAFDSQHLAMLISTLRSTQNKKS